MFNDPIIDEIHKHREETAKRFNYDVSAFFADLITRQANVGERFVVYAEPVGSSSSPKNAQPLVTDPGEKSPV